MRSLVFLLVSGLSLAYAQDQAALRECSNVHSGPFHPPNANASYENLGCSLACRLDDKVFPIAHINEDYACPGDATGFCHGGKCIGSLSEAQAECTKEHHFDFSKFNTTGTGYSQDFCALNCVMMGQVLSHNARNEGTACRDGVGICRKGVCDRTGPTVTFPTTPYPLSTPASGLYDISKLESLDITILHGSFSLLHANTYAVICLVSGASSRTLADCKQMCKTPIVAESTQGPVWNHHCGSMKVEAATDLVLTEVWSNNVPIINFPSAFTDLFGATVYDAARHVAITRDGWHFYQGAENLYVHIEYQFRA